MEETVFKTLLRAAVLSALGIACFASAIHAQEAEQEIVQPRYRAVYVRDILLDYTKFKPGEEVRNVWTIRNEGTEPWHGFTAELVYGAFNTSYPESLYVPDAQPGEEVDVDIVFNAPATPRDYIGVYLVTTPDGLSFRQSFWLAIRVRVSADR